jgi:hypothetical protein
LVVGIGRLSFWPGETRYSCKLFDFTADRYRFRPFKTREGQFYSPISSATVEGKIHDGDAPEFSAHLHIENFSDLLDLAFG